MPAAAPPTQERVFYRDLRTRPLIVFGTTENFADGTQLGAHVRPVLHRHRSAVPKERRRARPDAVSGAVRPTGTDPIGKMVRVGAERYTVIGVFDKRPGVGGFNAGQDDFVVIPYTVYQRQFGLRGVTVGRGGTRRHARADPDRRAAARGRRRRQTRSPTSSG